METKYTRATTSCEQCSGDDQTIEALQAKISELRKENRFLLGISDGLLQIVRGREEKEHQALLKVQNCPHDNTPPTIRAGDKDGVHGRVDREGQAAADEVCTCQCVLHHRSPNTVVGEVRLGLVRAGDVARLGDRARKELDDGLRAIAKIMFPRAGEGSITTGSEAMIALLLKVSLKHDILPQAGGNHARLCHDAQRGTYQRASDARYAYMSQISESQRPSALYHETFLQLALFRGIDLDEVA